MIEIEEMSVMELVAYIQSRLHERGIDTVLSGGTCVTIWSDNAYISDDIDLIVEGLGQRKKIRTVMLEIGFKEVSRYFEHPGTKYLIEFPAGPPSVGEERPKEIEERNLRTGVLRLLSATDCIKDRLTWWFHNNARQCLDQAIAVAQYPSDG